MRTTNVKESKKNSGWFLAIPHEDEKGFEALAYLRKNGYFNTPLYRLNRNASQKQIVRYYLRFPQREHRRVISPTFTEEERLERLDWENLHKMRMLETKNRRLEKTIAQLEAEKAEWQKQIEEAEAQAQYMDEAFEYAIQCGLAPGWSELPDINQFGIEKDKIGSEEFVDQVAKEIHGLKSGSNARFVTPDMSATLGRGTHVLIDIDKVPKDLQVLLAKMMDTLNNHTLRISNLENC